MDISGVDGVLRKYGVDEEMIAELHRAAAPLTPVRVGFGIGGLDELASMRFVSYVLRLLGPALGVKFDHPDVLTQAGFPVGDPGCLSDYFQHEPEASGCAAVDVVESPGVPPDGQQRNHGCRHQGL